MYRADNCVNSQGNNLDWHNDCIIVSFYPFQGILVLIHPNAHACAHGET